MQQQDAGEGQTGEEALPPTHRCARKERFLDEPGLLHVLHMIGGCWDTLIALEDNTIQLHCTIVTKLLSCNCVTMTYSHG